jgi:hypothetical protein
MRISGDQKMAKFALNFDADSTPVLDRVIEAYGFTQKIQLAEHLEMAASSLSSRYKRGGLPSDIVLRCMADTGVELEWLITGQGKKFDDDELDIMKFTRKKLIDGQLFDSGHLLLDKVMFLPGIPLPQDPACIIDNAVQYIVDRKFSEVYDGDWLVELEGKVSIRTLTRIPIKRVRVSGVGMAFDCNLDDVNVIGKVVLNCRF